MTRADEEHVGHADSEIAYHVPWGFRREALLWQDGLPAGLNLHPIASELHSWLLQQGRFSLLLRDPNDPHQLENPYAFRSSVLAAILARVVDDAYEFANSKPARPPLEVEAERIRIFNELVLYTARFCEASIKQLLYCTSLWRTGLQRLSLGALLSRDCPGCKGSAGKEHKVSLLGSLAHGYRLCIPFEQCLFIHLGIAGRRRNSEAAHSETQTLQGWPVAQTLKQMDSDLLAIGKDFTHMLEHISDLERRMAQELVGVWRRGVDPLAKGPMK